MRVIAGSARGRLLKTPDGTDVRPTTDKVKESLFSIIQFELPGSSVLDLFAGTGQLGIEALSRGAENCTFVDRSRKSLEIVKSNVAAVGFGDRSRIVLSEADAFLQNASLFFDVVLMDPPYHKTLCDSAFRYLPGVLSENAVVICETQTDEVLPDSFGEFGITREYKYSAIKLTVYRRKSSEDAV